MMILNAKLTGELKNIKSAEELLVVLADLVQTEFHSRAAHWNVSGPSFSELHDLYGESYKLCAENIDTLGENYTI